MPKIRINEYDYHPYNQRIYQSNIRDIDVTFTELLWGALTVGRRSRFDVSVFGIYSIYEVIWRIAIVAANLETVHLSYPVRGLHYRSTQAFQSLDGSEKGAVSYFLGLATSKIVAERLFQVPWIMHLDVYSALNNAYNTHIDVDFSTLGRRRPDLIGVNSNNEWLVLESKGRSGSSDNKTRINAKRQSQMISFINGVSPTWRYGAVTHHGGGALCVDLIDPPESSPEALPIKFSMIEFFRNYYRLILDLINDADYQVVSIMKQNFDVIYIGTTGIKIGINSELRHRILRSDDDEQLAMEYLNILQKEFLFGRSFPDDRERTFVGMDGICVIDESIRK